MVIIHFFYDVPQESGYWWCRWNLLQKTKKFFNVKSHTDRGKHYDAKNLTLEDFHKYKFPALNLNLDELSCALGHSVLLELPNIIKKKDTILLIR